MVSGQQRDGAQDDLLRADLHVTRGGFALDLELSVGAGEVVALVGPNGAGKTTTLRALAGLLRPDRGSVVLGGRTLDRELAADPIWTPPHRRSVAVVFQDYLLFPHLTVLDNVAFGPRAAGLRRPAARQSAHEWLRRMDAADLASLRPAQLSGGQAQRVALARALATGPDLLLLDEPLAALDARTRLSVRGELRRHLAVFDGATIVITHDPTDAAVLADRLVVIEFGRLVQQGTPAEVARRPRTDYVARLVGLNLLSGRAMGSAADGDIRLSDGTVLFAGRSSATGAVYAAFRPAAVSIWPERPEGSPRNIWPVEVVGLEPYGDGVRVELDRISLPVGANGPAGRGGVQSETVIAEVTPAAVADLDLVPGRRVWASIKASEIEVYPI
jgi:molybdate transport system ATP-binding protein